MKQFMSRRKAMLYSILNHKLTPPKIRMSSQKTIFLYAVMICYCKDDLLLSYAGIYQKNFVSSFISFIMYDNEFSTTWLSFGKANLHQMHDRTWSHSGLFKNRISNFSLLW